jgi:hypothetical protein
MVGQLILGTALGHQVAAAYAKIEGVSAEEHVMQRYGSILRPAEVAERVAELLSDPRYASGVAYGFRANTDIMIAGSTLPKITPNRFRPRCFCGRRPVTQSMMQLGHRHHRNWRLRTPLRCSDAAARGRRQRACAARL